MVPNVAGPRSPALPHSRLRRPKKNFRESGTSWARLPRNPAEVEMRRRAGCIAMRNNLIERGEAVKETGTVKWFSAPKGYGFILRASGEEVFVHYSAITMEGYRKLDEGAEVEFELMDGPKGLQALEVVRIETESNGKIPGPPPMASEFAPAATSGSAAALVASVGA